MLVRRILRLHGACFIDLLLSSFCWDLVICMYDWINNERADENCGGAVVLGDVFKEAPASRVCEQKSARL